MDRKWVYLFTELEAAEASAGDWEAATAGKARIWQRCRAFRSPCPLASP